MSFTYVESSEDHDAWLEAKRHLITATDVSLIAHSGTAGWVQLKARKAGTAGSTPQTRYMQWGIEREAVIAQVMSEKYPWLSANHHLVRSDDNPLHGATPDMVGDAGLCQIKTSLWKGKRWTEPPQKYVDQMLWELHVTGLEENILAVEYYEDTPFGLQVVDPFSPPQEFLIVRDEKRLDYLLDLVNQFLNMGDPSPMDSILADWSDLQERKESILADEKALRDKARAEIGDADTYKHVSELGSVTLSTPKPRRTLDKTAVERDFELTDDYYKTITSEPSLRVTPAREGASHEGP